MTIAIQKATEINGSMLTISKGRKEPPAYNRKGYGAWGKMGSNRQEGEALLGKILWSGFFSQDSTCPLMALPQT
jgi:hypothetical protein